MKAVLTMNIKN